MSFVSTHLVQSLRYSVDLCAEVYRLQRNIMRAKQNIKGNCTYLRKRATDVSIDVWKRTDKIAPPPFPSKNRNGGAIKYKKMVSLWNSSGFERKDTKNFCKDQKFQYTKGTVLFVYFFLDCTRKNSAVHSRKYCSAVQKNRHWRLIFAVM